MNTMGGSELVGVIGKLVNGIDILIMIIMSNQRNQISITDGKSIGDRIPNNGNICHAAKETDRVFLRGNKVSKRVIDQHLMSAVICQCLKIL